MGPPGTFLGASWRLLGGLHSGGGKSINGTRFVFQTNHPGPVKWPDAGPRAWRLTHASAIATCFDLLRRCGYWGQLRHELLQLPARSRAPPPPHPQRPPPAGPPCPLPRISPLHRPPLLSLSSVLHPLLLTSLLVLPSSSFSPPLLAPFTSSSRPPAPPLVVAGGVCSAVGRIAHLGVSRVGLVHRRATPEVR